ncbi:MAG: hypothetical protein KDA61_15115, partial [Planctomycetales bacterium]|nr:hypothetical protein [Planctomycetales bacterium]
QGDQIEVATGDFRTVTSWEFASTSGGQDGKPRGLNDRGDIVVTAHFTDGSTAVLKTTAWAVPEPASAGLAFIFAAMVQLRPVRSRRNDCQANRQIVVANNEL